jgi:hypothetical protein
VLGRQPYPFSLTAGLDDLLDSFQNTSFPCLRSQVQSDAALILVDLQMRRTVVGGDLAQEVMQIVTAKRTFVLDDVCAEIA